MHIWVRLYLKWRTSFVGSDDLENRYFEEKKISRGTKKRRFVLYKGNEEASKIPALWHAWLHYTSDSAPGNDVQSYAWEQTHVPNLTGTQYAHSPKKMHMTQSGTLLKPDYTAWTPGN